MSKRKFGFEGFGINRQQTYNFDKSQPPQRLYVPPSSRAGGSHDNYEDTDLDNIEYDDVETENKVKNDAGDAADDDDIDPLDAFMEGIHEEMKAEPKAKSKALEKYRDDDEDDPMESYLKAKKDVGLALASEVMNAGYNSDEEVYAAAKAVDNGLLEYDEDDNPIMVDKKRIEPIAPLDHSCVDYEAFNKDFYEEKPSVSGMTEQDVSVYRKSLAIRVSGFDVPRPVKTFEDCGFSVEIMKAISRQAYEKPTLIQCQALPIILSGRDIIGIAKTGSGKTAAFVLPMMVHIMDQPELEKGEGPIGVICAPTRELTHQIYLEAKKFSKSNGIRVSAVYGGMSKLEQFKELKAGCEIVVATPGRLIDLLKMKALTMSRATYLVLDEADRMFDLGFEPQIRSIVGQIRPDHQTLLFSATMPRKVEKLMREILTDPIRVTVGEVDMANEYITQVVHVVPADGEKFPWLLEKLPGLIDNGDVLVFASKKATVDMLETQLAEKGFKVAALHGDKDQASRTKTLQQFKSGVYHVLIATDVAARGLNIKSIKSVVNFDIARDMDMHVHRIGRTGRARDKDGTAYTLITQKEAWFAGELANSLIVAGQDVPMDLMDLAMKDGKFRLKRDARKRDRETTFSDVAFTGNDHLIGDAEVAIPDVTFSDVAFTGNDHLMGDAEVAIPDVTFSDVVFTGDAKKKSPSLSSQLRELSNSLRALYFSTELPIIEERVVQRKWCSCTKRSACKTEQCGCRAARDHCDTSCLCDPDKCGNRRLDRCCSCSQRSHCKTLKCECWDAKNVCSDSCRCNPKVCSNRGHS